MEEEEEKKEEGVEENASRGYDDEDQQISYIRVFSVYLDMIEDDAPAPPPPPAFFPPPPSPALVATRPRCSSPSSHAIKSMASAWGLVISG